MGHPFWFFWFMKLEPKIRRGQKRFTVRDGGRQMFRWAIIFLVVTCIAGLFAFAGLLLAAAAIAKLIFYLFLVLFLLALIAALLRKARPSRLE
jgi:uncharacterized membrane protein YtjA (UPF0391 family)